MKRLVFVAKSMVWSLLLYVFFMLAFNWDDLSNKIRGVDPVSSVNTVPAGNERRDAQPAPASISPNARVLDVVIQILDTVASATM